ncbi:hypothetical protein GCM10025734_43560 [Kitasatospora paranensis]
MPEAAPSSSWVIPRSSRRLRSSAPSRSGDGPVSDTPTDVPFISRRHPARASGGGTAAAGGAPQTNRRGDGRQRVPITPRVTCITQSQRLPVPTGCSAPNVLTTTWPGADTLARIRSTTTDPRRPGRRSQETVPP